MGMTEPRSEYPPSDRLGLVRALRRASGSLASAYIGLSDIGGRPHLSDIAIDVPSEWGLSTSELDGRPARQVFDLPKLWETIEPRRFTASTIQIFRHGPALLPGSTVATEPFVLCAPILNEQHLFGFLMVWGFQDWIDKLETRATLTALLPELHDPLLATLSSPQREFGAGRSAILSARTGAAHALDTEPHHPLNDLMVSERTREAVLSMSCTTPVATATAHGWQVHFHRIGPDLVAARMVPLRAVPLPMSITLTTQQRRITRLAIAGLSAPRIGHSLDCSPETVRVHLRAAYKRLGVRNRTQLANVLGGLAFLEARNR